MESLRFLSAAPSQLGGRVTTVESDVDGLETRATGIEGDVTSLQGTVTGHTSAISTNTTSIAALERGAPLNLMNTEVWTTQSGTLSDFGGYTLYENPAGENKMESGEGPFGDIEQLWKCDDSNTEDDAEGGWDYTINGVSDKFAYLSVVYLKVVDNSDGRFLHGPGKYNSPYTTLDLSGNVVAFPYFAPNVSLSALELDVWYVSVGVIFPYNSSGYSTGSTKSGLYKVSTGEKVNNYTTYMMNQNQTSQQHRSYMIWSTDTNTEMYFARPGFYKINGTEPSIQDLCANTSLGTFTGSTIDDDRTVKEALQELETAVETNAGNIGTQASVSVDPVGSVTTIDAIGVNGSRYTFQPQDYVYDGSFQQSNITSFDVDERGPSYSYGTNVYYNGSIIDTSSFSSSPVNIILSETEDRYVHWNSGKLLHKLSPISQNTITASITDAATDEVGIRVIYISGNTLYSLYNGNAELNISTTGALKCALEGSTFAVLYSSNVEVYQITGSTANLVGTISLQAGTTGVNVDIKGNPLQVVVETNSYYDVYHNAYGTLLPNGGNFTFYQSIMKEVGAGKPRFAKNAYFLHANNALYYKPDFTAIFSFYKLVTNVSVISETGNNYVIKDGDVLKHFKLRQGSFHDWHTVIRPVITDLEVNRAVPNPTSIATTDLTGLRVGSTTYGVTPVEANPTASGTTDLTKLKVGSTTYDLTSNASAFKHENNPSHSASYAVLNMANNTERKLYFSFPFNSLNLVNDSSGNFYLPPGRYIIFAQMGYRMAQRASSAVRFTLYQGSTRVVHQYSYHTYPGHRLNQSPNSHDYDAGFNNITLSCLVESTSSSNPYCFKVFYHSNQSPSGSMYVSSNSSARPLGWIIKVA